MMSQGPFSAAMLGSLSGIEFGKESHWFVSHVDQGSGLFYLQQNEPSISVKYERQMQQIERSVLEGKLESFSDNIPPTVGCLCIAQYSEDKQWYRGQVLGFVDDGYEIVDVVFIDYGNGENISWKCLKKSPKEFTELPPQAIQCKLANIEPVGGVWSKEGVKLLKELILERELVGIPTNLCKSGAVVVKLYADEEKSAMVAKQLVMAGFGYWKRTKSSLSQSSSSSCSSTSNGVSVNTKPGQLGTLKIKTGSYFDLYVSFIDSIDSFYCQPVAKCNALDELGKEMQTFYNSDKANELKLAKIVENQVCCARYSADAVWYRGIVKKVSLGQNYEVQFVDYGNCELLPSSEIRELTGSFKSIPISSVHCSLLGVKPKDKKSPFDNDAIQRFEQLTVDKQLVGYVSQLDEMGRLAIVLFDTTESKDGININKELAKLSNVVYDTDVKLSPVKSSSAQSVSEVVTPHFVSMQLNAGSCDIGYVAYAQSPFDFSCQLSKSASNLDNMMQELNEEYLALKAGENKLQIIEAGIPCCARYSGDGRFYRAELKSITGTNAVVSFVDYGNEEQCRLDEIKHLRKEYLKLPKQAFKCRLAGIQAPNNGDLPLDVCARFNDMVIDKEFNITFDSIDPKGLCEVSLVENNDRNVLTFDAAKVLIDADMVEPVRKFSKDDLGHITTREQFKGIEIPKEDYIDVMPTHVISPNEFCCQLLENSDKIDALMADLESTYKNSIPSKYLHIQSGMPCAALYPVDENWYRGSIVHAGKNEAEVNYVDFGNTEKLHVDKIRRIHMNLMQLPAQAFVCSLADVSPKGGDEWPEEVISLFSDLTLEKQLIACVKFKDESNLHHVELLDTQTNRSQQMNIADILIEKGLAIHTKQKSKTADMAIVANGEQKPSDMDKKAAFSDVKLKPGDEETVYVSHIDDLSNIYCQLTRQEDDLYQLLDKLSIESEELPPVTSFTRGKPVCAMFSEDHTWYRGEIIMEVDSKNASVRFVDYGNSENVKVSSMREMSSDLLQDPRYGIPCVLYSEGLRWKEDAVKELFKMTADKVMKMTVKDVKNEKCIIELYDDTKVNISSKLALANQTPSQNMSKQRTAKELIPAVKKDLIKECINIEPGMQIDCFISFIESLKEFYIQPCDVNKDLGLLGGELAKAQSFPSQNNPKKGDICCANYDDMWYRAEIIKINGNEVEAFFFDYGNSDMVKAQNIKSLPEKLLKVPRLSIGCSLHGVTSQSDEDIDTFSNLTLDHQVSAEFIRKSADRRYDVKLKVNGAPVVFDDKGRKDPGLHVDVKEASSQEENAVVAAASDYSTAQSPAVIVEFNDKLLGIGAREKIFVCYVVTAQEFYCQLSRESDDLNGMMDMLEEYYGSQPPGKDSLISLVPGVPCAAKYSVDGCWYRAALKAVQGPTEGKVSFVDYGNVETVEIKDLKILRDEFIEYPTFAIKCGLMGDIGSPADFESNVMDREFDLKVIRMSGNTHIVDLVNDGRSLSDDLCGKKAPREKVQTQVKSYKEVEMQEGNTVDVYYVDGKSPEDFYCHLVKYETEFETLVNDIAEAGNELETLNSLETGAPCVALFSEDESWYRGKILESREGEAKIEFVDYGNEEWVKTVSIKIMPDKLLQLPIQAVKFCLENVQSASETWSTDEIKLFQEKCDQKMLTADIMSHSFGKFNVILRNTETGEVINEAFKKPTKKEAEARQNEDVRPCFRNAEVSKGMTLEALCTFVKENGELSCQLAKYEEDLNTLMDEIAAYCDGDSKRLSDIKVDMACIALYDEDGSWYRAKILKSDGRNATVKFVDYGNESVCALENLIEIRPKDLGLSVTCIDCRISGLDMDDDDVVAAIEETCIDKELKVIVKDVMNEELVLADVLLMENNESICDIVNKQIVQAKGNTGEIPISKTSDVRKFGKLALDVGASESVICTGVTSFNFLVCQVLRNQEEFDEMMDEIAMYCEENGTVLKTAVKGQCCFGRYSVDDEWYRAEILSVSNDQLTLRYVDYGNEDVIKFADTREMVNQFTKIPALSITCKLHDMRKKDVDMAKAKKLLEDSCIDNEYKINVIGEKDGIFEVNMYDPELGESVAKTLDLQEASAETDASAAVEVKSVPREEKPDIMNEKECTEEAAPSQSTDENLQYMKLQLKSEKLPAICSFIDENMQIYCQPTEYSSDLDQLMAHIADHCTAMDNSVVSFDVGDPCFAMFSDDGEWYRAEIVKIDDDLINVFYVDYGNHGNVKKDQLLPMTKAFMKLPKACFACVLQGSLDSLPMADVVKVWIEEKLIGEELEVEIKEKYHGDSYLATLYQNGKNIEEMMRDEFRDMAAAKEGDSVMEKVDVLSSELKDKEEVKFLHEDISVPTNEHAICTHVDSLHEVFVQLTKYQDKFDELSEKAQIYCIEQSAILKEAGKGSSCLAKFSEDQQWYRAEVIENMNDSVKVHFIDYGNTDIVLLENTRALSKEFVSLPATSIKCHLHDVHEEDIDVTAAVRWLKENLIEEEVKVEIVGVVDDAYDCILRKLSADDETINDQLYNEFELAAEEHEEAVSVNKASEDAGEMLQSTETGTEVQLDEIEREQAEDEAGSIDKSITDEGDGKADEMYIGKLNQETPKLGVKDSVKCTHIESLNCISIQLLEHRKKFEEISEKISSFCEKATNLPERFERGLLCLAKSEDNQWYRAEFIEISNDNVEVHFIDYGNAETVLKENTRPIKKEFASLPAMSITCQLHDVHDSDIDVEKAEEWLHENLIEHEIDVEIIGKIDESYDVIITRKNEKVSVNDLLYEKFEMQEEASTSFADDVGGTGNDDNDSSAGDSVKLPSLHSKLNCDAAEFTPSFGSISKSQPTEIESRDIESGSTFKMHLSFQVSPSLFWCQFDDSGDNLLNLMAEIENYYGENDVPSFDFMPKVGTICCAQFSEDHQWYRGQIYEIFDEATCLIHFIDYGNTEGVELCNIKELKSQFFGLTKQAIKCSLHGVKPVDGEWSKEAVDEFEDVCADRLLDVEVISGGEVWNVIVNTDDSKLNINNVMVEKGFGTSDVTDSN